MTDTKNTELVATFTPDSEMAWVAYKMLDSGELPEMLKFDILAWSEDDLEGAIGTIRIERKPVGYVASLPEFEGW